MRILHTADWHLGQLFHGYDRAYEHQVFLDWLCDTLREREIDVLLISGDVFDFANPPAAAVKMFYSFLRKAMDCRPGIQIVITAGNHDSAHRLEAPKPLLADGNIHIIGLVPKLPDGEIDYEKLLVPLYKDGDVFAWCMAVPYLRLGEHPMVADCDNAYSRGVEELYKRLYNLAVSKRKKAEHIIAMGHLHAMHCEISEADEYERAVLGGIEGISSTAFHPEIKYVALGHIHKAQRIAGKEHVRYCGSPLPMSFTEHSYTHQVMVLDMGRPELEVGAIEVPVVAALKKIPAKPLPLSEVLVVLDQLGPMEGSNKHKAPYLMVQVLLDAPEPSLRHRVESALDGKFARLCKVEAIRPGDRAAEKKVIPGRRLNEIKPAKMFSDLYESKFQRLPPAKLLELFAEAETEAHQVNDYEDIGD